MRRFALLLPLLATGCVVGTVARTAVDVVTLPVKAAGAVVDAATTSQSEADEKRGRALRKAEEAHAKKVRAWEKECKRAGQRGEPCPPRPEFVVPD